MVDFLLKFVSIFAMIFLSAFIGFTAGMDRGEAVTLAYHSSCRK